MKIHATKLTLKDLKGPQMTSKDLNQHQIKQKQKTIQKVDLYKRILKLMNTI